MNSPNETSDQGLVFKLGQEEEDNYSLKVGNQGPRRNSLGNLDEHLNVKYPQVRGFLWGMKGGMCVRAQNSLMSFPGQKPIPKQGERRE